MGAARLVQLGHAAARLLSDRFAGGVRQLLGVGKCTRSLATYLHCIGRDYGGGQRLAACAAGSRKSSLAWMFSRRRGLSANFSLRASSLVFIFSTRLASRLAFRSSESSLPARLLARLPRRLFFFSLRAFRRAFRSSLVIAGADAATGSSPADEAAEPYRVSVAVDDSVDMPVTE